MWIRGSPLDNGLVCRQTLFDDSPNNVDRTMKTDHLYTLSLEELSKLHEAVAAMLGEKIVTEKARLEERLRKLGRAQHEPQFARKRRYPVVRPKYRNPKNPAETWSGRGKLPRWLRPQLGAGRNLNDFLIGRASD
jgi:DNA-binding protein H-NS